MTDERDLPDIAYLRTYDEAAVWLRTAGAICSDTADHLSGEQAAYQRGRAHAFGLAARTIEDVSRRGAE